MIKGSIIILIIALLLVFIGITRNEYHKKINITQFSAFGGWQLGSNALYGYAYTSLDSPSKVPAEFRELHIMVNNHMKYINQFPSFLRPDRNVDIYYLWHFNSPLWTYMNEHWKNDSLTPIFYRWATMALLYSKYGQYLIAHHPGPFIEHYIWPNFIKYYSPPTGFLGYYNMDRDTVSHIAVAWFRWKNNIVHSHFKSREITITNIFPIGMAVINLAFVLSFIAFVNMSGFKRCTKYGKKVLLWMITVWFVNMIFSVLAAPIELRYQLFPMIITVVFGGLLLSYLIKEAMSAETIRVTYANDMGKSTEPNITLP